MNTTYVKTLILSLFVLIGLGIFAITASAQYYDPAANYYYQPTYNTYPDYSYQYQYPQYYPTYQYSYPQYQYPQYQYPQYNYATYDYPYYNQYTPHPLTVYCRANVNSSTPGQFVSWTAYASGGTGSYTYEWSGENVPNANSATISTPYYTPGTKSPTVTVSSGNRHVRQNCTPVSVIGAGSYHSPRWWPW